MSTTSKRPRIEEEEVSSDIEADIEVEDITDAPGTSPDWYQLCRNQVDAAKEKHRPAEWVYNDLVAFKIDLLPSPLNFQLVLAVKDVRFVDRDEDAMRKIRRILPSWNTKNLSSCEESYLCIRGFLTKVSMCRLAKVGANSKETGECR